MRNLDGQVVIVTGASRGLGLALTRELAGRGARLVLAGRDESRLRLAAEDAWAAGAEALIVPCDVRREPDVHSLVAEALDRFGRVDVAINNAGILVLGPLQALGVEDFRDCMDTMSGGRSTSRWRFFP